ncbi:class I SAM-dependent methyltransferase [Gracilibacillus sp. YIM 98692]|uniref:class I SAM-dependent methyltransferase n=1 Tax=Gracilibacillus sp. YIM 98692 TaxID=2663532 RepID=UPI0013D3AF29|nr:class I SAM-dependent methyltransferase [Gracilibacillus sp. YIM 98692]
MPPYIKDSWNAHLYDQKHHFVSNFGNELIELLSPQNGESILDIGCGTGDLAHAIGKYGAHVIGIDQSANMIKQAKEKYPSLTFEEKDVLDLPYHNEFHAVFSNATLHWVKQPKQALQQMFDSLESGGRLVAEFGGEGNVQLITDELIKQLHAIGVDHPPDEFPWYFPSIGEYTSLMEEVGFHVRFAQHFDRPTPLEGSNGLQNWIKMFAQEILDNIDKDTQKGLIRKIEQQLTEDLYKNGEWVADYKRIRVIGFKEKFKK